MKTQQEIKTGREWLKMIPGALEAAEKAPLRSLNDNCDSLHNAIAKCIDWGQTAEGWHHWCNLHNALQIAPERLKLALELNGYQVLPPAETSHYIFGCSGCGDSHMMDFHPLRQPDSDGHTHWAICHNSMQPVFLKTLHQPISQP